MENEVPPKEAEVPLPVTVRQAIIVFSCKAPVVAMVVRKKEMEEETRGGRVKNGSDKRGDRTLWRWLPLSRGYFRFDARIDAAKN